jgi:hypothetical protein
LDASKFTIGCGKGRLKVAWSQPGVLGQTRQHAGADFFVTVEGKDDVRPACTVQNPM